ncbi:hypothetical protein ENBRE01_1749 [Enteropsectra breve]|nr:hypothetical protein ENBRE01_1749 [Enteropsectra breve]
MANGLWKAIYNETSDFQGLLDRLVRLKYNKTLFQTVLCELKEIDLKDFNKLRDYFEAINKMSLVANMCVPRSEALTLRERNDFLLKGLPRWVKEEIARNENKPWPEIIDLLERIETIRSSNLP